ncbi:hypothetical protein [Streptomyces sp. NPDC048638]|uniref:hypothetical protein n=1 Tax=Streptomyces sp. NPDC048638 TaxID=3365580 RepID=UPI003721034E
MWGLGAADGHGDDLLAVDGAVAAFDLEAGVVVDAVTAEFSGLLVAGGLLGLVGGRADDGGVAVDDLAAVGAEPGAAGRVSERQPMARAWAIQASREASRSWGRTSSIFGWYPVQW